MKTPKFKVGDIVLFNGGLFRVNRVNQWNDVGSYFTYDVGNIRNVSEPQLTKADWRDKMKFK